MKFLSTFFEFLNEALRKDPHLKDRETERLIEAIEIKVSPEVTKALKESGIQFPDAQTEILNVVKKEVIKAIADMLRIDYPPQNSYILPVKRFEFEVDGNAYPVNIVAYSKGKGDVIKKNIGNQYWIPCYRNTFYTLLLYPDSMKPEEIAEDSTRHMQRNFGVDQKTITVPPVDFTTTFVIDNGKIVKKAEDRNFSKTVDVTGQWNLAPGREFKFWMPARNEWVRGEIVKVDNDPGYKTDKFFKIEMLVELGGKKVKMMKKVSPGDKLMIPVKTEAGEIDAPVTVHDSLFITDKRASSPIMKIK